MTFLPNYREYIIRLKLTRKHPHRDYDMSKWCLSFELIEPWIEGNGFIWPWIESTTFSFKGDYE